MLSRKWVLHKAIDVRIWFIWCTYLFLYFRHNSDIFQTHLLINFHSIIVINFYLTDEVQHPVLGSCVFLGLEKPAGAKSAALRSLLTKNAWVKEFLQLCSENCISWIFGLFFENAHEWKPHHWNPQEPRIQCTRKKSCN